MKENASNGSTWSRYIIIRVFTFILASVLTHACTREYDEPLKIAFTSNRNGSSEVFIMDEDGSNQTRLTFNGIDSDVSFSPDGTKIVFNRAIGNNNIYLINMDGSGIKRLSDLAAFHLEATWFPEGTKIIYRDSFNLNLYSMNTDGSGIVQTTNDAITRSYPSVSPDGKKIAYHQMVASNDIFVMNLDGSMPPVNITVSYPASSDINPSWSPDGSRILFQTDRVGANEIFVMDADGNNSVNLTNNPAIDSMGSWSPDGSKIVFESFRDANFEIYIMNADGSNQKNISNNPASDNSPCFQGKPR